MLFTYRRVSRIWVGPALAMVASVAILVGVAAIMAVVVAAIMAVAVAAACGAALLRAIGAIRPATPSVPFPDDPGTIEGVVVHSTDHGVAR
jgi:hypothetical protein